MSPTESSSPRKTILTKDTLVPWTFVLAVAGGAVWINQALTKIEFGLESLSRDIQAIERTSQQQWRHRDMASWAELLQAKNPELKVPEPNR